MMRSPPLHVLIVEDESLIAMDIAMMLEDAGHQVVGEAASLSELQKFGPDTKVHLALVDIQLAEGSNGIDALAHIRRCWPDAVAVFVTANPTKLPTDFAGAHGVIAKPFSTAGFRAAISYLEEGICDPPPSFACPSSLLEGPQLVEGWQR